MIVKSHGPAELQGLRVVLLRSAERAGGMAQELTRRGADVHLVPLIDFEGPHDTGRLDAALGQLEGYDWLVVTSVTTVRALKQRADTLRSDLPALVGSLKIAAVGTRTLEALEGEGLLVSLVRHHDQSAAGLLAELPIGTGRILLPQADIADDSLERGLLAKGWEVDAVVAYRTVDYPAVPERRLTASLAPDRDPASPLAVVLDPAGLRTGLEAGIIDAVVVSSPSIAHRFAALALTGVAAPVIVAIGARTAAAVEILGIHLDGIAVSPTPVGIADAVAAAVVNQQRKGTSRS
ncbi:uroporphyrinogen-III synthase [Arthrobacter sp. H5]|uniref:uroporphyrinogen-III synthase n=1 Tax=Arthrobacter sp. H5 TaxID=1267973 RepID=UPI0004B4031A|nr:uroporphyrinogen-III synthase [Arthrobacter sp. H5]